MSFGMYNLTTLTQLSYRPSHKEQAMYTEALAMLSAHFHGQCPTKREFLTPKLALADKLGFQVQYCGSV